jgi:Cys-tRNA(Pro)/Cys-tRNA(Cys) deacylase
VRVFVEQSALAHDTIVVNGGRRGLQIELGSAELVRVLAATPADLS